MSRKYKDREFMESAIQNNYSWIHYYDRLLELGTTMFQWTGLPDTIDERFLEMTLFNQGSIVFFEDKDLGYLALPAALGGRFNVYRVPLTRNIIANNGYNKQVTIKDSVIIWNNYLRKPSNYNTKIFAKKLYELDRTIDVNVRAQKTPVLIKCAESERLSMLNAYKEFDGNAPVIFADKGLNRDALTTLNTNAPYVADKLYTLKTQIWNEALTYLGINNVNITKKERLLNDEVNRNQGGTIASRYSRLLMRQQACDQINKMFGLNIWCDYRENLIELDGDDNSMNDEDGEGDE